MADASETVPSRRTLLATIGAAGALPASGCFVGGNGNDGGTWEAGGPPDRDGWRITFADRFEAGELDEDTWELGLGPPADADCAGSGCTIPENVFVDAETDRLVLRSVDDGDEEVPDGRWLADWTTGAVATGEAFTQTYGYFEAKARLPVQPGALPAFWMQPIESNPPEIDVYEVFGERPRELSVGAHVDCQNNGMPTGRGAPVSMEQRVDGRFTVFGCRWTPEHVAFFVDGEERFRVDGAWIEDCMSPTPMYLILCTHVIDVEEDFASEVVRGDPRDASYPYAHEIDWVRVWQREEWA